MALKQISVPDVGEAEGIELVEVLVAAGDVVKQNQSLVVLESDKASVELPAAFDGVVVAVLMTPGMTVKEGDVLLTIETSASAAVTAGESMPESAAGVSGPDADVIDPPRSEAYAGSELLQAVDQGSGAPKTPGDAPVAVSGAVKSQTVAVFIPDLGQIDDAEVIEVHCQVGDEVAANQVLMLLESDKASMEIVASSTGLVASIDLNVGDQVTGGEVAVRLTVASGDAVAPNEATPLLSKTPPKSSTPAPIGPSEEIAQPFAEDGMRLGQVPNTPLQDKGSSAPVRGFESGQAVHAGPAVRKLAREFGVALSMVQGSGPSQRILKEDVQQFVKARLTQPVQGVREGPRQKPLPDFSQFGEVVFEPLSRIRRVSAKNLEHSWQTIPQVTHFDEADITDLETFRAGLNEVLAPGDIKISPLAFVMKAVIQALKKYPRFNASIDPEYEHWVVKRFYNIGIAVETPNGLVVPNVKSADLQSIAALARSAAELAELARNKKLLPGQMQGTTFTISSLGGIGGTGFTPIVNGPEVAILGVARTQVLPRYVEGALEPRKILPLALSYDHRAIDGAEAARFMVELSRQLSDVRLLAV